jgi:hypothetical protein
VALGRGVEKMFRVEQLSLDTLLHRPRLGAAIPPQLTFNGDIIVVISDRKADEAIRELEKTAGYGIGFDMEWQPAFKKGEGRHPTALIQLSTCMWAKLRQEFWSDWLLAIRTNFSHMGCCNPIQIKPVLYFG